MLHIKNMTIHFVPNSVKVLGAAIDTDLNYFLYNNKPLLYHLFQHKRNLSAYLGSIFFVFVLLLPIYKLNNSVC